MTTSPLLQAEGLGKTFGAVVALSGIDLTINPGEVTCVLGDNGAGKSTLIKLLSGVHRPDLGTLRVGAEVVSLRSPREALERGIATVYQDLAMIPLLSIDRNFFLGNEPTKGWGPFRRIDLRKARRTTQTELSSMGIELRDTTQPVGTLSGGERQSVAIARAVYFGAKVLILDEPTAALGVKQAGVVLRYIRRAQEQGLGVIFTTHNPHHAYLVGDRFMILSRGACEGNWPRSEITREALIQRMSGGRELAELGHELEQIGARG
jgi:simple sugar transport system ATP-binding protein